MLRSLCSSSSACHFEANIILSGNCRHVTVQQLVSS